MKNNKVLNRTFKVSLVAVALGLVNSAWAILLAQTRQDVSILGDHYLIFGLSTKANKHQLVMQLM